MAGRSYTMLMYVDILGLVLTVGYGMTAFRLSLLGNPTVSRVLNFFEVLIVLLVYWLGRYQRYLQRSSGRQQNSQQEHGDGSFNSITQSPDVLVESCGNSMAETVDIISPQHQEHTEGSLGGPIRSSDAPVESTGSITETTDTIQ
ncbi:hypothetical protein BDQ17DRAFT_145331 [Cyathus striatus]|nr:hypothetical protein BDQ17DRAFT_145331 [Cyathus striatus]